MITEILIRYLHFVSIFVVFAAVLGQHLILRGTVTRAWIAVAQRLDIAYAVSVVLVLATGLSQWLWIGKPAAFYSSNPLFHLKFTLFLIIGVVSIYPSVFLGKNRKGNPGEEVIIPSALVWSVRIELLLLLFMPLLATLMAKGIGILVVD